jgi:uncharacterized protein (DUF2235 family)
VGWILDPIGMKPGTLPYTAQFPNIAVVRHAVSIDERRAFFRQNLVHPLVPSEGQDLKQLWFAGVHSDVGGSYPEAESGLSKIALRWMLREARKAKLKLDEEKVKDILGRDPKYAIPSPKAMLHNSLTPAWWLGEIWPKRAMVAVDVPGQTKPEYRATIRFNLGRRRFIEEGAHVHESVEERKHLIKDYRPPNLPRIYIVERENPGSEFAKAAGH